jgi:hypothetical protein
MAWLILVIHNTIISSIDELTEMSEGNVVNLRQVGTSLLALLHIPINKSSQGLRLLGD